jgi:hypothetical protein
MSNNDRVLLISLTTPADVCAALRDAPLAVQQCLSLPSTGQPTVRDAFVHARADRTWPTQAALSDEVGVLGAISFVLPCSHAAVALERRRREQWWWLAAASALNVSFLNDDGDLIASVPTETALDPRSVLAQLLDAARTAGTYGDDEAKIICLRAGLERATGVVGVEIGARAEAALIAAAPMCDRVVNVGHGAWCLSSTSSSRVAVVVTLRGAESALLRDVGAFVRGRLHAGSVFDALNDAVSDGSMLVSPLVVSTAPSAPVPRAEPLQVQVADFSALGDSFGDGCTPLLPSEMRSWVPRALHAQRIPCVVRATLLRDDLVGGGDVLGGAAGVDVLVVVSNAPLHDRLELLDSLLARFGDRLPPLVVLLMPQWRRVAVHIGGAKVALLGIDTHELASDGEATALSSAGSTFRAALRLSDAPSDAIALGTMMRNTSGCVSHREHELPMVLRRLTRWAVFSAVSLLGELFAFACKTDGATVWAALREARRIVSQQFALRRLRCEDEIPVWLLCETTTPGAAAGLPLMALLDGTPTLPFAESSPPALRCFDLMHWSGLPVREVVPQRRWEAGGLNAALFLARMMCDLGLAKSMTWLAVSALIGAHEARNRHCVHLVDTRFAELDAAASLDSVPLLIVVVAPPPAAAASSASSCAGRRVATISELETFSHSHIAVIGDNSAGKTAVVHGLVAAAGCELRSGGHESSDVDVVTHVPRQAGTDVHLWEWRGRELAMRRDFLPECGFAAFFVVASLPMLLGDAWAGAVESLLSWLRAAASGGGGHFGSAIHVVLTHCDTSGVAAFDCTSLVEFARTVVAPRNAACADALVRMADRAAGAGASAGRVVGVSMTADGTHGGYDPLLRCVDERAAAWLTVGPCGFAGLCRTLAADRGEPMTRDEFTARFGDNAFKCLPLLRWHGVVLELEERVFVDTNFALALLNSMLASMSDDTKVQWSRASTLDAAMQRDATATTTTTTTTDQCLRAFGLRRVVDGARVPAPASAPAVIVTDSCVVVWGDEQSVERLVGPVVARVGDEWFAVATADGASDALTRVQRHVTLMTDGILYDEVLADHCRRVVADAAEDGERGAALVALAGTLFKRFELVLDMGAYGVVASLLRTAEEALLSGAASASSERAAVCRLIAKLDGMREARESTVSVLFEFDPPLPRGFAMRLLDRFREASLRALRVQHVLAAPMQFVMASSGMLRKPISHLSRTVLAVCFEDAFALSTPGGDEQLWLQQTPTGLRCDMWWDPTELGLNTRSCWALDVVVRTIREWTLREEQQSRAASTSFDGSISQRALIPVDDKAALMISVPAVAATPRPAVVVFDDPACAVVVGSMISPRAVGVTEATFERARSRFLLPRLMDLMHARVADGPIAAPVWAAELLSVPLDVRLGACADFHPWISLLQREALYMCGVSHTVMPHVVIVDLDAAALAVVERALADPKRDANVSVALKSALARERCTVALRFLDECPGDWRVLDCELLGVARCTGAQLDAVLDYLCEWNDFVWLHAFTLLYTSAFWRQDDADRQTFDVACRFARLCNVLLLNMHARNERYAHDWCDGREKLLRFTGVRPTSGTLTLQQLDTGEWFLSRSLPIGNLLLRTSQPDRAGRAPSKERSSRRRLPALTKSATVEMLSPPVEGAPAVAPLSVRAKPTASSSSATVAGRPPLVVHGAARPKWCFIAIVGGDGYTSMQALAGGMRSARAVASFMRYKVGAMTFESIVGSDLAKVDDDFQLRLDALDSSVQGAIVYLSGHGRVLGKSFALFLESSDGAFSQLFDVRTLLLILLECSKMSKILLIIDACSSGSARELVASLGIDESRFVFVMTSSLTLERSFEVETSAGRFSLFSGALCLALERWATDQSGMSSAGALFDQLCELLRKAKHVPQLTPTGNGSHLAIQPCDVAPLPGADAEFHRFRNELRTYFGLSKD